MTPTKTVGIILAAGKGTRMTSLEARSKGIQVIEALTESSIVNLWTLVVSQASRASRLFRVR